jgi:glucose uptake protein
MFACMFCWGSWVNTYKLTTRWRYELFYYDCALGAAICAAATAFTLGSMNPQDLTFQDNFLIASVHRMVYAVGAGVLLNLANLCFLAGISVSGMAVAFPISVGLAVVVNGVWNYIPIGQANPVFVFGGALCLVVAVVLSSLAHISHSDALKSAPAARVDPRAPGATRPAPAATGLILASLSGILLGLVFPVLDNVRAGENAVSPYGAALLMAGGIVFSTFLLVPFLLNFPIQGSPVEFRAYFKGSKKQHFWGIFGGLVWMGGTVCYLVVRSTPTLTASNAAVNFGVAFAAGLLGALWGLLGWREFRGSSYKVKMLLLSVLVLYAVGLGMMALAPLYAR